MTTLSSAHRDASRLAPVTTLRRGGAAPPYRSRSCTPGLRRTNSPVTVGASGTSTSTGATWDQSRLPPDHQLRGTLTTGMGGIVGNGAGRANLPAADEVRRRRADRHDRVPAVTAKIVDETGAPVVGQPLYICGIDICSNPEMTVCGLKRL